MSRPAAASVFSETYEQHHRDLVRVAFLMTGSVAVAEDLVHDVFVACHDRLPSITHPPSYLRTAVMNRCRTQAKINQRFTSLDGSDEPADEVTDRDYELHQALLRLTHRQRAAVVLRFYADLSYREISNELECPEATARSLVHRGLDQLRKVTRR